MDFSSLISDLPNLPPEPSKAWAKVAEKSLSYAHDVVHESSEAKLDDTVNSLVIFLNDFASAIGLDSKVNRPSVGISAVRRLAIAETEIAQVSNKSIANELANRLGISDRSGLQKIEISNATLVEIHPELQKLRNSVAKVTMEDEKRERLVGLLNSFERELNSKEITKSGTLTVLATVCGIIVGTTAFLAEAPDALETVGRITGFIGAEIENAEKVAQIEFSQPAQLDVYIDGEEGPQ